MNRIKIVEQNGLPKAVADNIKRLDDMAEENICGDNIAYISKNRQWLRRFDSFDLLREERDVQLSPLEVVQTMERHLGFLAGTGYLAIPRRMHYMVPPINTASETTLYSLVDHIRQPYRAWYDPAYKIWQADMAEGLGLYVDWAEAGDETYGLYDLARLNQGVRGCAPSQTQELTHIVDLDPWMTRIGSVNREGYNLWDEQKQAIKKLASEEVTFGDITAIR